MLRKINFRKTTLFLIIYISILFSLSPCVSNAESNYNYNVPYPISGIAIGTDEREAVNLVNNVLGMEPTFDLLYYEHYVRGINWGGSNWVHIYQWVFDGKNFLNSNAYVLIGARKGKVVYIEVKNVRITTSTGVSIGDTAENFINSFNEPPLTNKALFSKPSQSKLEYMTNTPYVSKYEIPYIFTTVNFYTDNRVIYHIRTESSETYVGESPYTSQEEQLGSSNYSRDGIHRFDCGG